MGKAKKQDTAENDAKPDFFSMLSQGDTSELYDVIQQLMTANENLDMKTEVLKPRSLSILNVIIDFCKIKGLNETSRILESFREHYLRYMVSYKRAGRSELVEILRERKDDLNETDLTRVE